MIRYPGGMENINVESEVIKDFKALKWSEIIEWARDYLARNPDDGFWNPSSVK